MESGSNSNDGVTGYIDNETKEGEETTFTEGKSSSACRESVQRNSDLVSSDSETDLEEEVEDKPVVVERVDKGKAKLEGIYMKACRKLGIIPCRLFLRHISDEEIDISHYNIGPIGAKAVAKTLKENTTTMLINIHDNGIGAVGARAFADMLTENCFLTILDFSLNFIEEDGFEAMSNMLKSNKYITEISFASTKLNNTAAMFIGKVMEENATLRTLDLSSNEIGDEGSVHIANGIKRNNSILFLNLGCNHIRGKGIPAIADALMYNNVLKTIELNNNGCADSGARAIGNALKVNQTLREIDISQNRIAAEGAFALGIGLEENFGLRVLKLSGNPFQSRGAISIVDSLLTNNETALEELHFDDIAVSGEFEKLLEELLNQQEGLHVRFGAVIQGKEHRRRGKQKKVFNYVTFLNSLSYTEIQYNRIEACFYSILQYSIIRVNKMYLIASH